MNGSTDRRPNLQEPLAIPTIAVGWVVAATVAGVLVFVLLVLVLTGRSSLALPGLVGVVLLVWFAQRQFTETHRRRNHRWPGGWEMFWTGSPERRAVAHAWRHRAPARSVEACRLLAFGLLGLSLIAGIVFLGAMVAVR